jgi:predicted N-acetyltransferase YhbS
MSGHASVDIRFEADPDGKITHQIEQALLAALRRNVPPSDGKSLTLVARNRADIIGGLAASTSYGWLLIKMLWVADTWRNQGLGARLMADAESVARTRGCHAAWLDTSSAAAERFYLRLGYAPFGALENAPGEQPQGHRRAFLAKRFTPTAPPP